MNVEVVKSAMVLPAERTPTGSLWLSRLDLMRRRPDSHIKVLFVYRNQKNCTNSPATTPSLSSPAFFDFDLLKEALSKALVPFYPMAGRLKLDVKSGRHEIDCNAEGALLIEAETTHNLADLGDEMNPNYELRKAVQPQCDYSKGLGSFPLLIVQVTRFKCGGVSLAFAQHHHVADGASHMHFINSWARLAKGLDIAIMPVHDRSTYVAPRDPPQIKFNHLNFERPLPSEDVFGTFTNTKEGIFKITKDQVDVLRKQAMSEEKSSYQLSTFNVLAGHVWRSVCKARGLRDDQEVRLYMQFDGRSTLQDPALPQGYCGNVILCAVGIAKSEDIVHKPIVDVASRVYEAVQTMKDSEYFRSAIDYLESQPSVEHLMHGAPGSAVCPNLSINSWAKFPYKEADFGWGEPSSLLHGGTRYEGQSFFLPSQDGDGGFSLVIRLFSDHMSLFEKYVYAF